MGLATGTISNTHRRGISNTNENDFVHQFRTPAPRISYTLFVHLHIPRARGRDAWCPVCGATPAPATTPWPVPYSLSCYHARACYHGHRCYQAPSLLPRRKRTGATTPQAPEGYRARCLVDAYRLRRAVPSARVACARTESSALRGAEPRERVSGLLPSIPERASLAFPFEPSGLILSDPIAFPSGFRSSSLPGIRAFALPGIFERSARNPHGTPTRAFGIVRRENPRDRIPQWPGTIQRVP